MLQTVTSPLHILAIFKGQWTPGIGDPSLMGWLTVIAYFSTSILCIVCTIFVPHQLQPSERRKYRLFWFGVAVILCVLGINKQLDLQSWFTFMGRNFARDWGWYSYRRVAQRFFILILSSGLGLAFLLFISNFRQIWLKNRLACFGLAFLCLFVIGRASSFHHVDTLINFRVLGFRMNWILELGGISCIAVSSYSKIQLSFIQLTQKLSKK